MEGAGGRAERSPQYDVERDASYLADAFDARGSLDFFRLVAATVPQPILWDAFVRARDAPRTSVRRSRVAIFTAIVRDYVDAARRPRRRRGAPPSSSRCISRP